MRLRSSAIREAMKRREVLNANNHLPPHLRPPTPPIPPSNPRSAELERELMVQENKVKTSTMFVDSYTASDALNRKQQQQAGKPPTPRRNGQVVSRAGWPVEHAYFVKSVARPGSGFRLGGKKATNFAVTL